MTEVVQDPVEQQVDRPAYVAPPATLPVPDFVMAAPTPEPPPAPVPDPVPEPEPKPAVEPKPEVAPKREPGPDVIITSPTPAPSLAAPARVLPALPPTAWQPVPAAPKAGGRRLVGVAAIVLVLLVGLGVGIGLGRHSNDQAGTAATQGPAFNAGATPATQSPTPPSTIATTVAPPSPSPTTPDRPVTPEQALALTTQQAQDELDRQVAEDRAQVADLAGAWVPQVSSKCVGISVDIGPNWIPDGVDDTPHVTLQQILAFHISLRDRFNAVTLLPTQAGLPHNRSSAGPCAGSTTWMSAVPEGFASAAEANAWCAANVPPVRECGARYFARPGERSILVLRH